MGTNHRPRSLATIGYVIECHGVQIRAQLRSVATLVRVTGRIGPMNRDLVRSELRRFTRLQTPLVFDLLGSHGFDGALLDDLLDAIDNDGDAAGTDLTLVLDPAVSDTAVFDEFDERVGVASSVPEALHSIAERIKARRALVFVATNGALAYGS
jgi:hypothetical protein